MFPEHKIAFGCVADDDSGATDVAGMLTEKNVKTVILIDIPSPKAFMEYTQGYEAVVIANHTRAIMPDEARHKTSMAIRALQILNPYMYQIKYCSTFDSTETGNIGSSIDAAMDVLKVKSTVVVPALPINGRTTYMGYHFVNGQLLSDSPMKDHPLNPMRDSNLVRFLQKQTSRKVGLIPYEIVKLGTKRLRDILKELEMEGYEMIVVDAIEKEHLSTIAKATIKHILITGGSGITMEIPDLFLKEGRIRGKKIDFDHIELRQGSEATLIISGSCSTSTQKQNEYAKENGFISIQIDADKLIGEQKADEIGRIEKNAIQYINDGRNVIIYSYESRESIKKTQEIGKRNGLEKEGVGVSISGSLAEITKSVLDQTKLNKLIIAGGETSSHICRELGFCALEVGRQIDPGVPYCFSKGNYELALVLKSGNFGGGDFYLKAIDALKVYTTKQKARKNIG